MFHHWRASRKIMCGTLAPLSLVVLIGGLGAYGALAMRDASREVGAAQLEVDRAAAIEKSALGLESAMRGYLLVGDEDALFDYQRGEVALFSQIGELEDARDEQGRGAASLSEAQRFLRQWRTHVALPLIALRQEIGDSPTMNDMAALVRRDEGAARFDLFRAEIDAIVAHEVQTQRFRAERAANVVNRAATAMEEAEATRSALAEDQHTLIGAMRLFALGMQMDRALAAYLGPGGEVERDRYETAKTRFETGLAALRDGFSGRAKIEAKIDAIEDSYRYWLSQVAEPLLRVRARSGPEGLDASVRDLIARTATASGEDQAFARFSDALDHFLRTERSRLRTAWSLANRFGQESRGTFRRYASLSPDIVSAYEAIARARSLLGAALDWDRNVSNYLLAGVERERGAISEARARFEAEAEGLAAALDGDVPQMRRLEAVRGAADQWRDDVVAARRALRREIGLAATMDDIADQVAALDESRPFEQFREQMSAYAEAMRARMADRVAAAEEVVDFAILLIAIASILALVAGAALAVVVGRQIARPLQAIADAMARLAEGDATIEFGAIGRKDEIGALARAATVFRDQGRERARLEQDRERRRKEIDRLVTAFDRDARRSLEAFAEATTALNAVAARLSSATEAADRDVDAVADASIHLAESTRSIAEAASSSRQSARATVDDMKETTEAFRELEGTVAEVGVIVEMIADIADQTHLLALNANIEAARAGEAGSGFVVVAQAVKELARDTGASTARIAEKIAAVKGGAQKTAGAIGDAAGAVGRLEELARKIAELVEAQAASAGAIADGAKAAAAATDETRAAVEGAGFEGGFAGIRGAADAVRAQGQAMSARIERFLDAIKAA